MKLTKIFVLTGTAGFIALSLLGNLAFGQPTDIPGIPPVGPETVGGLVEIVQAVVSWVYIVFFIIGVLFILFAAFSYLTAGGDAERVAKAKNQLIYAAIAIAVALLAVGFEAIIRTFLTTPTA